MATNTLTVNVSPDPNQLLRALLPLRTWRTAPPLMRASFVTVVGDAVIADAELRRLWVRFAASQGIAAPVAHPHRWAAALPVGLLLAGAGHSAHAQAPQLWSFTGAPLSSPSAYFGPGPTQVQGLLELAAPLAPNLVDATVVPVGLAFSDGLAGGFNNGNGSALLQGGAIGQFGQEGENLTITSDSFTVSTNAAGAITSYSYQVNATMAGSTAWPTSFQITGNQNGDTVNVLADWPSATINATAVSGGGGSWVDPAVPAAPELPRAGAWSAFLLIVGAWMVARGRA